MHLFSFPSRYEKWKDFAEFSNLSKQIATTIVHYSLFIFHLSLRTKCVYLSGVDSEEVPPVPIPNTEVKLLSAENTWRAAAREDRDVPEQKEELTKRLVLFLRSVKFLLNLPRVL